jgi:hypothetical protein
MVGSTPGCRLVARCGRMCTPLQSSLASPMMLPLDSKEEEEFTSTMSPDLWTSHTTLQEEEPPHSTHP